MSETLNIYGLAPESIVDGPGIRFSVFCQGCTHHCKGCHNPESQAHKPAESMSVETIVAKIEEHPACKGVTLSGGEPFEQPRGMSALAEALKQKGLNVWCYTGYFFEDLQDIAAGNDNKNATKYCNKDQADEVKKLLENIDVLVDGPFEEDKKSYEALYCGSTNQRLIDVKKTLSSGKICLWSQEFKVPAKPSGW